MGSDGVRRREFLKRVPLFGAGAALGLNALSEAGEVPKARKLSGADIGIFGYCNTGTTEIECNTGAGGICNTGTTRTYCNVGRT
jgi:hypothetical protein